MTGSTTNLFVGNVRKVTFLIEKWRGKESESPEKTGKSGPWIAKKFIYSMNSFPATEGECTQYNFPSYFFWKVQKFWGEESESPEETGKSGCLITKKFIYAIE